MSEEKEVMQTIEEISVQYGEDTPEGQQMRLTRGQYGYGLGYQYHPPKKRWREKIREIFRIIKE